MSESENHFKLKEKAISILKSKGFKDNEISLEYFFDRYIIDVVGIKDNRKVFIECGGIKQEKLDNLNNNITIEFIHIPYPKEKRIGVPFNLFMPDELHKDFKIISIYKGKSMEDLILDLIKKYVKANRGDLRVKEVVKHGNHPTQ